MFLSWRILSPHYVNLSILKFPDIVKLHTCLFLYDHLSDAKSSNFRIPLLSDQHSYTTRKVSSDQLYIPFFRTNIKKFCPTIIGRYFWNDLPASIRSRPTKKLFRQLCFQTLFISVVLMFYLSYFICPYAYFNVTYIILLSSMCTCIIASYVFYVYIVYCIV